jgi:hypothetical protein
MKMGGGGVRALTSSRSRCGALGEECFSDYIVLLILVLDIK